MARRPRKRAMRWAPCMAFSIGEMLPAQPIRTSIPVTLRKRSCWHCKMSFSPHRRYCRDLTWEVRTTLTRDSGRPVQILSIKLWHQPEGERLKRELQIGSQESGQAVPQPREQAAGIDFSQGYFVRSCPLEFHQRLQFLRQVRIVTLDVVFEIQSKAARIPICWAQQDPAAVHDH